ncbi:phosphoenolpyruvate carboxylase [Ornithinimicrobium pratense]|uniref:Phosphoenolpyruvate carboxylase n=1 Tax=Ornithinimicrobium pratense TaxID=2593973 RepID=A0A5J6V501_9MICO|nr:phosphoenolpyruvate carboxylase [Ornithinimicrobium pratense]QFG69029.1 phosphoenolpyruvate carboxylase [Ornithinimicrobium pratense]
MERLARDLDLLIQLHEQVLAESGEQGLADPLRDHFGGRSETLDDLVADAGPEEVAAMARALTVRLHLTNLVAERHRARSLRAGDGEYGDSLEAGDIAATVASVGGAAAEHLPLLRLHPVLTAHPTEARRRAVASALHRIAEQLDRHVDTGSGAAEKAFARRRMLEDIDILHRTSTLRTTRPEPLDEVRTVLAIFETTLFRAVPRFQRTVELALRQLGEPAGEEPLPALLRYGSWVGGDRDGNPHVTAAVTRQTVEAQAAVALHALRVNVERVARTLTMDERSTPASAALRTALDYDAVAMPDVFARIVKDSPGEPHRQKLLVAAHRLAATADGVAGRGYGGAHELIADLELVRRSLLEAGDRRAAGGELMHLLWMVETFGFHLAELEVRQHSAVHRRALVELLGQLRDADVQIAGMSLEDPVTAASDVRILDWLAVHGWPAPVHAHDPSTQEVLDTLRVMAWLQERWGITCCGTYIVSFSQSAGDLAAVRALARLAVGDRPLRLDVVPLFETGDDLQRACQTLQAWLLLGSTQAWLRPRDRRVEIMLGYSDSAKDVGPAAATLILHRAQQDLVAWAERHNLQLTLFHGRGGSMGRGGGPLQRAITAQPTGSVAGRFKVTEQGEVIHARYADVRIAQQHLERMASAVLQADSPEVTAARDAAAERYAPLAERLEETSRAAYRALMDTDGIADVLAVASPLDALGDLRLGSRPARRGGGSGRTLSDLRAIPWVFAWSMTRLNLPGWYGLGAALAAETDREALRAAYREWPVFSALVDVAEMSLAKSEERLAAQFLDLADRPDIAERILAELRLAREQTLDVLGQERLLERKPHLRTAVELRRPSVDALSRLQLRCLRMLHTIDAGEEAEEGHPWHRPLLLTINGMAAGLQNTG